GGGWEASVRAIGPAGLRPPLGRVLLENLFRPPAARRFGSVREARPARFFSFGCFFQPLEKIELPGHALGFCGWRRGAAEEVPALPHLPRLGDEPQRSARLDRGLERRGARGGEPATLRREVSRRPSPDQESIAS